MEYSNRNDWTSTAGEYSLILHNIENNIDTLPSPSSHYTYSTKKRSRSLLNDEDPLSPAPPHHSIEENNNLYESLDTSMSLNVVNISSSIRYRTQIEELKLLNEELSQKVIQIKDEQNREKEKFLRQLQFLENDNKTLKQELEVKNEKYYTMKKKLQSTMRNLEQLQSSNILPNTPTTTTTSTTTPLSSSSSSFTTTATTATATTTATLQQEYEIQLLKKNEEIRQLSLKNIELEEKYVLIEQQLMTFKADSHTTNLSNHSIELLQKENYQNERKIKKYLKDIERLELQLKNQELLENELLSLQQKVLQLKQFIKNLQEIEIKYGTLLKEKETWNIYFKDIITQFIQSTATATATATATTTSTSSTTTTASSSTSGTTTTSSSTSSNPLLHDLFTKISSKNNQNNSSNNNANDVDDEISPILVLRYMTKLQNKCLELLQHESQLQYQNSELKSSLLSTEKLLNNEISSNNIHKETIEQLNKRIAILQQQSILYEGEVMSLRSLLKTYDLEFQVILGNTRDYNNKMMMNMITTTTSSSTGGGGGAGAGQGAGGGATEIKLLNYEKVLNLKDLLITDLRKELNECKINMKEKLQGLEGELNLYLTESKKRKEGENHQEQEEEEEDKKEKEGEEEQEQEEIKKLKLQCKEYREELFLLQSFSRIDYLPSQTKILRVKRQYNPSYTRYLTLSQQQQQQSQAEEMELADSPSTHLTSSTTEYMSPIDELKALRRQNKSLQLQLKDLQQKSSTKSSDDLPSLDTSTSNSTHPTSSTTSIDKTKDVIDSSKLNIRLKEMFRERISSYREAIYLLFGFKVDLINTTEMTTEGNHQIYPQLRLKSMYAENPDDSLIFQWKGGSNLELLETSFAANLDESILQTLQASNSIPVFLSNISLDLYEKQTYLGV